MRKSVLRLDPGYDIEAHLYEVFFDGEILDNCLTADEDEGFVLVINDFEGTKKLYGKIKLTKGGN